MSSRKDSLYLGSRCSFSFSMASYKYTLTHTCTFPKNVSVSVSCIQNSFSHSFIHSYIRRCILSSQSTIFPLHPCSASYWANTCNKCTTMAVNLQCGIISKMQTVYILSLILSLLHLWGYGERWAVNCSSYSLGSRLILREAWIDIVTLFNVLMQGPIV